MRQRRLIDTAFTMTALFVMTALTIAVGACRKEPTVPDAQSTSGPEPRMQPVTVAGCLKSGIAEKTFVLTAAQARAGETATYQLVGADDLNLRDHVGEQVEVSGTLRSQQKIESSSGRVEEKAAKGTTGKPVVETKTDVELKLLDVSSMKPSGNRCQQ